MIMKGEVRGEAVRGERSYVRLPFRVKGAIEGIENKHYCDHNQHIAQSATRGGRAGGGGGERERERDS